MILVRRWLLSTTLVTSAALTRCSADPRLLVWDRYDTGVPSALPDAAERDTGTIDPCAFCALPHARASCDGRVCAVLACSDGYADCDRVAQNGCETSLTSAQNCGSCGRSCGSSSCNMGTCDDTRVVQLALGHHHSCALRNNHTVKCWGRNDVGQLGNGTTSVVREPVDVRSLSDALQITAGQNGAIGVTCARTASTLACWGNNSAGHFGNGTLNSSSSPVRLSVVVQSAGLSDVSAGHGHICGITATGLGLLACWGQNIAGELGTGQLAAALSPQPVILNGARHVRAGGAHTCASSDGQVWCWGANDRGQLGNGTTTNALRPAALPSFSAIEELSLGDQHSCARAEDGSVWCWGDNNAGQLGDGTSTRRTRPTQVSGLTSVIALSAGATHTCAVRAGGGVQCWGANNARQLGDGTNVSDRRSPTPVIGLPAAAVEIAAGAVHTCARLVDHRVYCWGDNTYGQVNANASEQPQPPTLVPGLN